MATHLAFQTFTAVPGETLNVAVSFDGWLDVGETITDTPRIVDEDNRLTLTNKTATTAVKVINGVSVAAGRAVTFTVSGQVVAYTPYTIKITIVTSAGATRVGWVKMPVAVM